MQTEIEQQTTTQTKKTSLKGKKITKKETNNEVIQQQSVVETIPVNIVESVEQTISEPQIVPLEYSSNDSEVENVQQDIEYQNVFDFMNVANDKFIEFSKLFKEKNITKDERAKLEVAFKKLTKSYTNFQTGYNEYLSREVNNLEKKSGNKSATKKMANKEKAAIHKKLYVHPFLLEFMKLPKDTMVSRSDALTAITGYVKEEKSKNPDINVENDKKSFKLIGDLALLFKGIQSVMLKSNIVEDIPTQIRYTDIMKYMSHCFVKNDVTVSI